MPITFPQKPGIIAYLTAGDPDLATTRDIALAAIDNGADVIELGVPFSDPLADGPVIQRASERAVARGTTLTDVLTLCADLRQARPQAGLILFSYLNPVVRMGLPTFCEQAAQAGADGVLLTDMIVEEATEYLTAMRENQLAPIFLAAPTSPDARLKAIAEASLSHRQNRLRLRHLPRRHHRHPGRRRLRRPHPRRPPPRLHRPPHRGRLRHLERSIHPRPGRSRVRRRRHHRQRPRRPHRKNRFQRSRQSHRLLHRQPPHPGWLVKPLIA